MTKFHRMRRNTSALALSIALVSFTAYGQQDTGTSESWISDGEKAIQERLAIQPITKRAKNVILFVGDGMGISTLTSVRANSQVKAARKIYYHLRHSPTPPS